MELNQDFREFIESLNEYEVVVQLCYPPNRIDLLVDLEGVEFEKCFKRKTTQKLEGVPAHFIGIDDLIVVKQAAGRLQDLADAEQLERIRERGS